MAKQEEIDRREIILLSIAIALSTALVGPFQKIIESFTENQSGLWLALLWALGIFLWIVIVMLAVVILLRVFSYKIREEKE